jgi:NAD(P)-dependent dehydrogenase (short-subunit alcohol dehydrogenase family)
MRTGELGGRRALVTGASRGIGRVIALALAGAGASVVATARASDALEETIALVTAAGGKAEAIPADLTDPGEVDALARAVGAVDVLVNNAAAKAAYTSVLGTGDAAWHEHLAVSLLAPVRLIRELAPGMVERRRGVIITLTSSAAVVPVPFIGPYAAAKRAAEWVTRLAAMELGPAGVRAVSVAPGLTSTEVADQLAASGQLGNWLAATPSRRLASPEEIAATIVWAASDAAGYLNGATLVVDGGHTAGEYHLLERMATHLPAADPLAGLVGWRT